MDPNSRRGHWPLARVIRTLPGPHGIVRAAQIRTDCVFWNLPSKIRFLPFFISCTFCMVLLKKIRPDYVAGASVLCFRSCIQIEFQKTVAAPRHGQI